MAFVKVCENDCDELIEVPLEDSGTLLLSSLNSQFSQATGLKYKTETATRLVRCVDHVLFPPHDGWGDTIYYPVYPKLPLNNKEAKRRAEIPIEEISTKSSRMTTCSDLIILSLPWSCTTDQLKDHFQQFGEVAMVEIKKEVETGRPKGYGFVRFFDYEAQIACLLGSHVLDGRQCRVRVPNSKLKGADSDLTRRIFVGRVSQGLRKEVIERFFSSFGHVTDVFVPEPFRSFVFVTFSDPQVASSLVGQDLLIDDCSVHISTAVPRDKRRVSELYCQRGQSYMYTQHRSDETPLDLSSLNICNSGFVRPVYPRVNPLDFYRYPQYGHQYDMFARPHPFMSNGYPDLHADHRSDK